MAGALVYGCSDSNSLVLLFCGVGKTSYQPFQTIRIIHLETDRPCPEKNHLGFVPWLSTCRESTSHCPGISKALSTFHREWSIVRTMPDVKWKILRLDLSQISSRQLVLWEMRVEGGTQKAGNI